MDGAARGSLLGRGMIPGCKPLGMPDGRRNRDERCSWGDRTGGGPAATGTDPRRQLLPQPAVSGVPALRGGAHARGRRGGAERAQHRRGRFCQGAILRPEHRPHRSDHGGRGAQAAPRNTTSNRATRTKSGSNYRWAPTCPNSACRRFRRRRLRHPLPSGPPAARARWRGPCRRRRAGCRRPWTAPGRRRRRAPAR